MALSNALAAQQWAAALAAYQSSGDAGALQAALTTLFGQWNTTPAALANVVTQAVAALQAQTSDLAATLGVKNVVASVQALPPNPAPGDTYIVSSTGHVFGFVGGRWVDFGAYQGPPGSTVVSMCFATNGPNTASEAFPAYQADGSIALNAAASTAAADTLATNQAVFTITRNGAAIGTATFAAGSSAGVVALTATAISAGDRIRVVAPAIPDATLSGVSITVSGNRQ